MTFKMKSPHGSIRESFIFLQIGQFGDILFALYAIRDSYSLWHLAQINQAFFCEFTEKSKGVLSPFLVGCHSSIISGRLNPNELHTGHRAALRINFSGAAI